jgi:hypothetical protein
MSAWKTIDDPIRLGSMLFTLVEPRPGHEVAYNRWYERDHFYGGCMVGPFQFAGQRFVATRDLKARRFPATGSPITPDPSIGSYLGVYWVLAGHHDEWSRWAVDQVNMLHATGRMFPERDHIHTALYDFAWAVPRDGDDGVPAELALDHRFPGMVAVAVEGDDGPALDRWFREDHLPTAMAGSPVALCLSFTPIPLLGDAPSDVPRQEGSDKRFLHLYFLDVPAVDAWPRFEALGDELEASGRGRVVWASPFLPTIPGTDTYTDQLH